MFQESRAHGETPKQKVEKEFATPMRDILDELHRDQETICAAASLDDELEKDGVKANTEHAREYVIEGVPTPRDLERLTQLPFEVSITEHERRLILSTGTPSQSGHIFTALDEPIKDILVRHQRSLVSFHSHPERFGIRTPLPGYADLMSAAASSAFMTLAAPDGFSLIQLADDVEPEEIHNLYTKYVEENVTDTDISVEDQAALAMDTLAYVRAEMRDRLLIETFDWDDEDLTVVIKEMFETK